jgi:hypothetical protein
MKKNERNQGVGLKEWVKGRKEILCKGKKKPINAIVKAHEQINHHNKVGRG